MPFGFRRGKGRGRTGGGKFGSPGRPGHCVCPQCGAKVVKKAGLPCFQTKCPRCGAAMTRPFTNRP